MAHKAYVNEQRSRTAAAWTERWRAAAPAAAALRPEGLVPGLALAAHLMLVAGQLLRANRSAGVQLAGRDADLGAHAELTAVGKLRRGVVHHDSGIDLVHEADRRRGIFGDDSLGVVRAVAIDVGDGVVEILDHLHRDDRRQVFGLPVRLG